jgi:hypothetical protein
LAIVLGAEHGDGEQHRRGSETETGPLNPAVSDRCG